jgi:hypothetical protein
MAHTQGQAHRHTPASARTEARFSTEMTTPFHDTFFAYVLRSAFGSRVFPYQDEIVLPTIWQDKVTFQASPRGSIQPKLDDTLKPDVASVLSEAVTTANTQGIACKDPLLIDWDGSDDTDVSCRRLARGWHHFSLQVDARTHETGRVPRRHGSCFRPVF